MNAQAMADIGDNAGKKFKEYNDVLDVIENSLLTAQDHLKSHNTSIFGALGQALDLGHLFAAKRDSEGDNEWSFLKDFVTFHQKPWTAKCESNIFHGLVTVAFDIVDNKTGQALSSAPQMSRYRTVLRYAFEKGMTGDELIEQLEQDTLSEVYDRAVSLFRFDPFEQFVEDKEQRFDRASKELLRKADLPSGEFTADIPKPDIETGFVPAMLHVDQDGFKLVGLMEGDGKEALQAKVASLVPAQAKRSSTSLASQPGYALFVACDLFTRFLPKIVDVHDWAKAAATANRPALPEKPSEDELADYLEKLRQKSSGQSAPSNDDEPTKAKDNAAKQLAKKFVLLDALRFEQSSAGWSAHSLTTQPYNPCCRMFLPRPRGTVPFGVLDVTSKDAVHFVDQFPRKTPWRPVRHDEGLALQSVDDATTSFHATDLDDVTNWRTLDRDLELVARFSLSKSMLDDLSRWQSELKARNLHGRIVFHRHQLIELVEDQLQLVLPDRTEHRRAFGKLTLGDASPLEIPRFFDFHMVQKLIQFSLDYGVSYELNLLKGHQGLSALRVSIRDFLFEASVTLPLMLSQKGNPVEITFPDQSDISTIPTAIEPADQPEIPAMN